MRRLMSYLSPIKGYYLPEAPRPRSPPTQRQLRMALRNKGYRNLGFWLNSFFLNTGQTLIDVGGGSYTVTGLTSTVSGGPTGAVPDLGRFLLSYGSSGAAHDVTRYELYSRIAALNAIDGLSWPVAEASSTKIVQYCPYITPGTSQVVAEAGLYVNFHGGSGGRLHFLLARTIISPSITKDADTFYEEGWLVEFPANYTRVLPYMLTYAGLIGRPPKCWFRDVTGTRYRMRYQTPYAGSPDLMIGSDNRTPSPDDYNLLSPIGSLSSQSQSVEVDTALQEVRIIRSGTITPTTSLTLGEVGLFMNVLDDGGTARKAMIARGVWETPVTLEPGQTYAIGIALRLG